MSEMILGQKRSYGHVRELTMRLRRLALTYEPDERLPKRNELCQILGTSTATLNEVLERSEAQKVIYRRRGRGIFVSPELFRTGVAIVFNAYWLSTPDPSPFWGNLLGMFAQQSQRRKEQNREDHFFYLLVAEDRESGKLPEECMQMIQEQRIHGVLSVTLPAEVFDWIKAQGIPHVSFAGPGLYSVGLDTKALIRMGVERLARQGCRRIALWGVTRQSFALWEAFATALHEHGLAVDPQLEHPLADEWWPTLTTQEIGYSLVEQAYVALGANRPDGVVSIEDQITQGILDGLQHYGIRIGTDVFIATHSNRGSMLSFNLIPGLTVIDFDLADIVAEMFNLLDYLLAGGVPEPPVQMIVPRYRTRDAGAKTPTERVSR